MQIPGILAAHGRILFLPPEGTGPDIPTNRINVRWIILIADYPVSDQFIAYPEQPKVRISIINKHMSDSSTKTRETVSKWDLSGVQLSCLLFIPHSLITINYNLSNSRWYQLIAVSWWKSFCRNRCPATKMLFNESKRNYFYIYVYTFL